MPIILEIIGLREPDNMWLRFSTNDPSRWSDTLELKVITCKLKIGKLQNYRLMNKPVAIAQFKDLEDRDPSHAQVKGLDLVVITIKMSQSCMEGVFIEEPC